MHKTRKASKTVKQLLARNKAFIAPMRSCAFGKKRGRLVQRALVLPAWLPQPCTLAARVLLVSAAERSGVQCGVTSKTSMPLQLRRATQAMRQGAKSSTPTTLNSVTTSTPWSYCACVAGVGWVRGAGGGGGSRFGVQQTGNELELSVAHAHTPAHMCTQGHQDGTQPHAAQHVGRPSGRRLATLHLTCTAIAKFAAAGGDSVASTMAAPWGPSRPTARAQPTMSSGSTASLSTHSTSSCGGRSRWGFRVQRGGGGVSTLDGEGVCVCGGGGRG